MDQRGGIHRERLIEAKDNISILLSKVGATSYLLDNCTTVLSNLDFP